MHSTNDDERTSAAAVEAGEEVARQVLERIAIIATHDFVAMRTCYTEDASTRLVGFVPFSVTEGVDAIIQGAQSYCAAFPDDRLEVRTMLVNGKQVLILGLIRGTNSGSFMGMPATNNTLGLLIANHLTVTAAGQIAEEHIFADQSTWMAQLMDSDMPHRPAMEYSGADPLIVVTRGDQAEDDNVARIAALSDAYNRHDLAAVVGHYTDDATWVEVTAPHDHVGKPAISEVIASHFQMSSNISRETVWMWGAGDYVAARFALSGVNDGPSPGGGPATGKSYRVEELHVYKLHDGAISEHRSFGNAFALMVQLGLAPDPSQA
ncbi:MAG: ester cyclase [Myxococcota bacterium]